MERLRTEVYDPDPTDFQMRALESINLENLQAADLATPITVQVLIQEQRVVLSQLKASQNEVRDLRNENVRLRDNREKLRVELAQVESHSNISWLEIPVSILSGFAINMLTDNISDSFGWILLFFTVLILLGMRARQIASFILFFYYGGNKHDDQSY